MTESYVIAEIATRIVDWKWFGYKYLLPTTLTKQHWTFKNTVYTKHKLIVKTLNDDKIQSQYRLWMLFSKLIHCRKFKIKDIC
jgi:hypothetical protein